MRRTGWGTRLDVPSFLPCARFRLVESARFPIGIGEMQKFTLVFCLLVFALVGCGNDPNIDWVRSVGDYKDLAKTLTDRPDLYSFDAPFVQEEAQLLSEWPSRQSFLREIQNVLRAKNAKAFLLIEVVAQAHRIEPRHASLALVWDEKSIQVMTMGSIKDPIPARKRDLLSPRVEGADSPVSWTWYPVSWSSKTIDDEGAIRVLLRESSQIERSVSGMDAAMSAMPGWHGDLYFVSGYGWESRDFFSRAYYELNVVDHASTSVESNPDSPSPKFKLHMERCLPIWQALGAIHKVLE